MSRGCRGEPACSPQIGQRRANNRFSWMLLFSPFGFSVARRFNIWRRKPHSQFLWVLCVSVVQILLSLAPVSAQNRGALHVPADHPTIADALNAAPGGAVIQIAAGEYVESLVIDRPVMLRGSPRGETVLRGASDAPVIYVHDTRGVMLDGLTISGGEYGVLVFRSRDVTISQNVITDNRLAGVKVRMGAADILNNRIVNTQPPYGRGIHITNTQGWPASRIVGNIIAFNALSGVTTNMAGRVLITDNTVADNGQRGIAVTEMSDALVANNVVEDNSENGIYVSDTSMATVCNNTVVSSLLPTITGSGRYGNGITVDFGSQVELHNNTVTGNANYGISVLDASFVALGRNDVRDNGAAALWQDDRARIVGSMNTPELCT